MSQPTILRHQPLRPLQKLPIRWMRLMELLKWKIPIYRWAKLNRAESIYLATTMEHVATVIQREWLGVGFTIIQ